MWAYIPSIHSACSPEAAGSTSGLNSHSAESLSTSLTLSAKPTRSASLRRRWKTAAWLRRLSGLTCAPFAAHNSAITFARRRAAVESGRSSPGIPARTSRVPAGVRAFAALAGRFGGRSLRRLRNTNPSCCFSKTWAGTLLPGSIPFAVAFERWIIGLRGDCLRRRKSAPRTNGSDCSFWHSASTRDHVTDGPAVLERYGTEEMGTTEQRLRNQAMTWLTPHGAGNVDASGKQGGTGELGAQATEWPTPAANAGLPHAELGRIAGNAAGSSRGQQVQNFVEHDCRISRPAPGTSTPGKKCSKSTAPLNRRSLRTLLECLSTQGDSIDSSLLAEIAASVGRPAARRLNAKFVEWLMGWPDGLSASGCSETEWSRWRRRMRLRLSALVCGDEL